MGVARNSDKVTCHGGLVLQLLQTPGARGLCVGQRLQRVKTFGADDKQRLGGVQAAGGFGQRSTVDVGDEFKVQVALAVMLECLVGHHRAEVRTADADVDHVTHRPSGMASPAAAADLFAEAGHACQHRMHLGNHINAVNH